MTSGDGLAWLDAHVNLEALNTPVGETRRATHPTLDRIQGLTELLGSPQLDLPVIHVTGTNGKTSVARLTTDLLVEQGLSVGTYTSPHLERVHERITWNGEEIPDDALDALLGLVAELEPHLEITPSYFEILTAVALRWFADVAVDVAIVEVGLGGTWDATNVVDAEVAVVTNVSVDHVEYLGPTPLDIATEKAGIVEPASTLVLGETDAELVPVFEARGASEVLQRDRDFGVTTNHLAHGGRLVSLFTPWGRTEDVLLSLHGAHQADNAVAALDGGRGVPAPTPRRRARRDRVRSRSLARTARGRRSPAARAARRRAQRRRCARPARRARRGVPVVTTHARRGVPPREGPVGDARGAGCNRRGPHRVRRPPSPRALDPADVAEAAVELGVERDRIDVVDTVPEAVALGHRGRGARRAGRGHGLALRGRCCTQRAAPRRRFGAG